MAVHDYPLHHTVDAECQCCGVVYDTVFTSKSDQVVCRGCIRHQASDARSLLLRNADHKALWRSEVALLRDHYVRRMEAVAAESKAYREEVNRLQEVINELKQTIRDGLALEPPESVLEWLVNEAIDDAETERDRAFRSRANAYRALWAANALHHHEVQRPERCSCGKPAPACKELRAIADMEETLYRWEHQQVERLKKDLEHELPDDHPEVLARPGSERRHWRVHPS
jgi:hypothetical protein